ncbi:uncharacterized protein LOC135951710 [Calliphora vicina]|uniref:uncharacterized protein LOC135951710 n=1 Tax=Calliphora vicina TaxID=7373 RepID=UPI00325A9C07
MTARKMYTIFMVLFLIQAAFCQPLDNSENTIVSTDKTPEIEPKPSLKLVIYLADNLISLGQKYTAKSYNVSRLLLNDETLNANTKPEVLEFKTNLKTFIENYDASKDVTPNWDIMETYANITEYYFGLTDENTTPEATFIVDLLNKYHCKELEMEFVSEVEPFVKNFKQMFEENKVNLDKPLLDWYENFETITDFQERFNAFNTFILMV